MSWHWLESEETEVTPIYKFCNLVNLSNVIHYDLLKCLYIWIWFTTSYHWRRHLDTLINRILSKRPLRLTFSALQLSTAYNCHGPVEIGCAFIESDITPASGSWITRSTVIKSPSYSSRSTRFLLYPPAISSYSISCSVETLGCPNTSQFPIRTPASRSLSIGKAATCRLIVWFLLLLLTISIKVETNSSLYRQSTRHLLVLGIFILFYEKLRIQLAATS